MIFLKTRTHSSSVTLLLQQVSHARRVELPLQIGHVAALSRICVRFGVEDLLRRRLVHVRVSAENSRFLHCLWHVHNVLFEGGAPDLPVGRTGAPEHGARVLRVRGDVGDVGAAHALVELIDPVLQVGWVVSFPPWALVLPEKARQLAPILIVLKRGLPLQETAKAGVAQGAVELLLALRHVHTRSRPLLRQLFNLLVPFELQCRMFLGCIG